MIEIMMFDGANKRIGEITPHIDEVTWRLNEFGVARLTMSKKDPKVNSKFLQFGNRALIRFDNGLPNFGGIVEMPRKWTNQTLTFSVFSAEYILKHRMSQKNDAFDGSPPGAMATALISSANALSPMGITFGDIWSGGSPHKITFNYKKLYDAIKTTLFSQLSSFDYYVVPSLSDDRLIFDLYVEERRGVQVPTATLAEGKNLDDNMTLEEQGPIYNSITVIGDGQGWDDNRPTVTVSDSASISFYGLRETTISANKITDPATLQTIGDETLSTTKDIQNFYDVNALDIEPAKFADYDLGDNIRLIAPSYGFDGTETIARVIARSYDYATDTCKLVLKEQF